MRKPALTFVGGAGTVTGSKYLLDTGDSRVLIDCGLFQGLSSLRRKNWQPPPFTWTDLDAVVLTHAHLDHCGYLPLLVRHGWQGPVYATAGTAQLAEIVLADSAHLLEEEAGHATRSGWSKHHPALPLYDRHDAARASRLLTVVPSGQSISIANGLRLRFGRAGHILGSSWAELTVSTDDVQRSLLTSGDLGRAAHALAARLHNEADWLAVVPKEGERVLL